MKKVFLIGVIVFLMAMIGTASAAFSQTYDLTHPENPAYKNLVVHLYSVVIIPK